MVSKVRKGGFFLYRDMALVYFTPLLRYPQYKKKIRLGFYGGNNNV
jgi:hypothetical protein